MSHEYIAGVDLESLRQTPRSEILLPGLEKRTQNFAGFGCGGAVEVFDGLRNLFEDLVADVRRKAEGFTAFVPRAVVGKTAEIAMSHEEQQGAPESLGQRLSSLHTGDMARKSRRTPS